MYVQERFPNYEVGAAILGREGMLLVGETVYMVHSKDAALDSMELVALDHVCAG